MLSSGEFLCPEHWPRKKKKNADGPTIRHTTYINTTLPSGPMQCIYMESVV